MAVEMTNGNSIKQCCESFEQRWMTHLCIRDTTYKIWCYLYEYVFLHVYVIVHYLHISPCRCSILMCVHGKNRIQLTNTAPTYTFSLDWDMYSSVDMTGNQFFRTQSFTCIHMYVHILYNCIVMNVSVAIIKFIK